VVALIVWLPTGRLLVVQVAMPDPLSETVHRVVMPSLNVTLPPGVPPVEVTVAVNVAEAPKVEGLELLETTVFVMALLTTWVIEPARRAALPLQYGSWSSTRLPKRPSGQGSPSRS
jgi:hypothetical protein